MKKVKSFYLLLLIFGCFQAFGATLDTVYDQIGTGGTSSSALDNVHAQNFVDLDAELGAYGTPTPGGTGGAGGSFAQKIGYEGVGTLNVGQAISGAAELVAGSKILGDSVMKEGEVGASDVMWGAGGGAVATHGAVNMLRSSGIPIGPVTTGIAVAAGAALGAGAVGTRILTQNDCFHDNVLNMYACCHTVAGNTALSGGVLYEIGEAAHCTGSDGKPKFGYITYCEQGGYRTDQGLKGKFLNDEWSECEESWCDVKPENSDMKINEIAFWKKNSSGKIIPCWKWECAEDGYIKSGNTCVLDPNAQDSTKDKKPGTQEPNAPKGKTCDDMYAGYQKRLNCCKAGTSTKWAKPEDLDGDHCYCVVPETQLPDDTKTWNGARCVEKSNVVAGCKYTIACSKGSVMEINLSKEDLNGLTCEEFNAKYVGDAEMAKKLADKNCPANNQDDDNYADKKANTDSDKIRAAQTRLKEFFSKVNSDKSVWKNADGSFNGVRLASDLTAGVVLGTVGGVVSGVLIKKSQVEKGFDALNCTINGQKVADWGDEFTVGLRR